MSQGDHEKEARDDATRTLPDGSDATRPTGPTNPTGRDEPASSASLDGARFAPGTILAGRYRLVAMLGRGGMGEVYRAEDLKLGETVALKFLPEEVSLDAGALARFHREVRVARQIAHRNVCRVHDIGEAEGWHFLTMEYIDGEDLSVLLRRIGRLPEDKAVTLAREISAGLAAAHEAGILHRDLKPANVMIDGRGHAKITDFGLATLQDELREGDDHFAGTPAYMAPEQFRGDEPTKRTDLYSLGLVLYEMFTGESAFPAEDWRQIVARGGRDSEPVPPSAHVENLDPSVERAILRCLRDDPGDRPRRALEVAASLPGGDPLRAALEAGETPSPEMVAAGAEPGRVLSRHRGLLLLAVVVFCVFGHQWLGRYSLLSLSQPQKSPEILQDRASEMLEDLEWSVPGEDFGGYTIDGDLLVAAAETAEGLEDWRGADVFVYWFRRLPTVEPSNVLRRSYLGPGEDSPGPMPGAAALWLQPGGRLLSMRLDPPAEASPGEPRWATLWRLARLDPARFEAREPRPPHGRMDLPVHDRRWAWRGRGEDGEELLVRAASFGSQPVSFVVSRPGEETDEQAATDPIGVVVAVFFLLLAAGIAMAVRHVRDGRSDPQSALRLALFVAAISGVGNAAVAISGGVHLGSKLVPVLASCAFRGAIVWVLYLAIEPPIRRRAPALLVSWTRLLRGRWRDPAVGADVLRGLMFISVFYLVLFVFIAWRAWLGESVPFFTFGSGEKLSGLGFNVWYLAIAVFIAVAGALGLTVLYSLLVGRLRRETTASIVFVAASFAIVFLPNPTLRAVFLSAQIALFAGVLARYGVLAGTAFATGSIWIHGATHTLSPDDWWAWPQSWLPASMILLLAFAAYRSAVGDARSARPAS